MWCSRTNITNAWGLVCQSSGNPWRFSKTVFKPVAPKRATASSVYLPNSVSKIPLVHKVGLAVYGKEYPPQVVKQSGARTVRCFSNRRLDTLRVLVKDRLTSGFYLRQGMPNP